LFQRFLHNIGSTCWVTKDALWLTLHAFKIGLVRDDVMSKENADIVEQVIVDHISNNKPKYLDTFMG